MESPYAPVRSRVPVYRSGTLSSMEVGFPFGGPVYGAKWLFWFRRAGLAAWCGGKSLLRRRPISPRCGSGGKLCLSIVLRCHVRQPPRLAASCTRAPVGTADYVLSLPTSVAEISVSHSRCAVQHCNRSHSVLGGALCWQMRSGIGLQGFFRFVVVRQFLAMYGKGRSDPQWIDEMVSARICRVGMYQDTEAAMIEHEPGH